MNAIAYLRVSTDEQADSGAGLNAQLDACLKWCESNGTDLAGTFSDDGVSGSAGLDKRPGLLDAIADLGRGDVLLVAKRDRLSRGDVMAISMIEAAIQRKGARIVSAAGEGTDSDNPSDVLMRRMVDAFAEYERLVIGARTKAALQGKIRRGERCGKVRFGYDLDSDGVTLVPNAAEQEVVELITDLRTTGMSLRAIAAELTQRGVITKEGNHRWSHTAINRILSRAA